MRIVRGEPMVAVAGGEGRMGHNPGPKGNRGSGCRLSSCHGKPNIDGESLGRFKGETITTSLLALILGAAAVIRWDGLGVAEVGTAESFSWRISEYDVPDLLRRVRWDTHPPLYYLVLKAWAAVFGSSETALRSLSAVMATLAVAVMYFLFRDVYRIPDATENRFYFKKIGARAALFSAFLVGIHASQVTAGRTTRMYAMGVFLAGLTALLLLRALGAKRRQPLWWTAYGVAVAAFCYTHYYAFFTVFAEALFVAADVLVGAAKRGLREALTSLEGMFYAGAIAILLYLPWLPSLAAQVEDVRANFWIPPLRAEDLEGLFFSWLTGMSWQGELATRVWLVALMCGSTWVLCRADRAVCFFCLQALLPWVMALAVSYGAGRPLLIERYLVFSQFALLGLWGAVSSRFERWPEFIGFAGFICVPSLLGLGEVIARHPTHPPALAKAAQFLKCSYKKGDVIFADSPAAVNGLYYYAQRAGMPFLDVRCCVSPLAAKGHVSHLTALRDNEIVWIGGSQFELEPSRRIWQASAGVQPIGCPAGGMRVVEFRRFEGGGNTQYFLSLYEGEK